MKKKFNLFMLSGIGALTLFSTSGIFANTITSNNAVQINQTNNDIDLQTEALFSNVIWKANQDIVGKILLDNTQTTQILENESVLSKDSINTVRSADYYFNFVNDADRENKVNLIASPINGQASNLIVEQTNIDEVVDSAIYLNENLLLVATINSNKYLINYQIENVLDETQTKFVLKLQEKSRVQITWLNSIEMTNKKYGLSPFAQVYQSMENTSIALWPMGANISDLSNNNQFIKEIFIDQNGMIQVLDVNFNFNFNKVSGIVNDNDQVVSLTPIRSKQTESQQQTKFVLTTRSSDGIFKAIEFGQLANQTNAFNIYQKTENELYTLPSLEKVMPYALVRLDENNNFSLFWISQNEASRANPAITLAEQIVEIKINLENFVFEPLTQESIRSVPISQSLTRNSVTTLFKPSIHQISYPVDNSLNDANMGIRMAHAPDNDGNNSFGFDTNSYNSFKTGILPIITSGTPPTTGVEPNVIPFMQSFMLFKSNFSSLDKASGAGEMYMTTVANGIAYQTGLLGMGNQTIEAGPSPFISFKTKELFGFNDTWTTSLATDTIILPEAESSNFVGIDRTNVNEEIYNLPVSIKDIDFSQPQLEDGDISEFSRNSILWYARYYISDIFGDKYLGEGKRGSADEQNTPDNIVLTGKTIFKNEQNEIVEQANASQAEIQVTVGEPLSSGNFIIANPITLQMNFIDNPNNSIANDAKDVVVINQNSIQGLASQAKSALEIFAESKVVDSNQNVIGFQNSNALFEMNALYANNAFQGIEVTADDFLGQLNVKFYFQGANDSLYWQEFSVSGFWQNLFYIPIAVGPTLLIALIVLIVVLVLRKRNKNNAAKAKRAGVVMSKKIDKSEDNFSILENKDNPNITAKKQPPVAVPTIKAPPPPSSKKPF